MTTHLLLNERPLQVLPTLAAVFGINEAIAIQQIHWVITIKHEHQDDKTFYEDFMWCKYTLVQWGEKMPWLSGSSIFRLFKKLENEGIIKTIQPYASSRDQTKWYRIDYDVLHVRSKTASSQNDDLPSSQIDQIRSSQNDYMINRSKDLKNLNKKQGLQDQEKLPSEQKPDPLSDLSKPEDPKTPPIAPPAPRNYAQEMTDRFSNKTNRFAPKGLDLQGFADWHLGGKRNNWHLDLIAVAKVHLKKHEKPFGDGDAINFINAICMREDWAKFELFADEATARQQKEQSQAQRSQQQPAPIAVQELTATAPPAHIRERFKTA
jgi:hypothetical protein